MKKIASYFLIVLVIFLSCKKNERPTTALTPTLIIAGVRDSVIIAPGTMLQYSATPAGTWSINNAAGGTIDNAGKLLAGNRDGVYTLTIVNTLNTLDTLRRKVIVSKHANIFNGMKSGGYLLSFRHAAAATGADQFSSPVPNWWKSCDPTLARQITDPIGYKQSDSTGYVIKLMKLPFDSIMTSEYCRCKQTAEYFKLGLPIKEYQALTYYVYDENNRYENTMNLYETRSVNAKNYIAVTHAGLSNVPSPAPLASLQWGDCAVFKLIAPGTPPMYINTIKVNEWMELARR